MTLTTNEIRKNLLAWIEDLETTDAKQGHWALRTEDDEYCCLGRACLVLGLALDVPGKLSNGTQVFTYEANHSGLPLLRPDELELLGLSDREMQYCWWMNDGQLSGSHRVYSFKEIAAWLRAEVLPRYPAEASVDHAVTETVAS